MARVVEFPMRDGGVLLVEATDLSTGPVTRGLPSGTIEKAATTFESALECMQSAASAVLDAMHSLAQRPEAVEVQFGVKLSGKVGAVLSSVSGEAHFLVTLRWPKQPSDSKAHE